MLSKSRIRQFIIFIWLLPIFTLSACLKFPFFKDSGSSIEIDEGGEDRITNINIKSMRIPTQGERMEIVHPHSGETINVIMGKVFTSASGKTCSNVTIIEESSEQKKQALACLNERQEWDKNPLNIQMIDN